MGTSMHSENGENSFLKVNTFKNTLEYRNTPLNLPGATISNPPGPVGQWKTTRNTKNL